MYNNCLNENSSINPNNNNNNNTMNSTTTTATTLMNNGLSPNDPSMLNIDLSLFEAAFKDATLSNRSLASSATFASNQLIAAANAARSALQQQQQHSLSVRTTTDSDCNSRGCVSAGANSKTNIPYSSLTASTSTNTLHPSLVQDAARSNPIIQLLKEVARQQSCTTCGKDKPNNNNNTTTDSQFLTPKSLDLTTSHVSYFLFLV